MNLLFLKADLYYILLGIIYIRAKWIFFFLNIQNNASQDKCEC